MPNLTQETVKILFFHPNPVIRAKAPRILDFTPKGGERQYFEPKDETVTIGRKKVDAVVYELPATYARRLLSAQRDRYFLLKPDSLIVPTISANGMATENIKLKSILKGGEFKLEEPKKEEPKPEVPPTPPPQAPTQEQKGNPAIPEGRPGNLAGDTEPKSPETGAGLEVNRPPMGRPSVGEDE